MQVLVEKSWELIKNYKQKGLKVIGCFPVYSPVELIHAAGMLPIGIFGGGNWIEITHADSRFVSFVCSIAKSTLELAFQKKLTDLDGIFFHSICDVARNLSSVFKRNFPLYIEYIHFPQNPSSLSALDYYYSELKRIKTRLEQVSGRSITSEALINSIKIYNHARSLVDQLYKIRLSQPGLLPTKELYILSRAFTRMPPDEFVDMINQAIRDIKKSQLQIKDRIKVVLEGSFCEQPPLELIENIEEAGCYIIDDDFHKGWRWFEKDVPIDTDPLLSLAKSYLELSCYSSVHHDWRRPRFKALIEKVKDLKADAVLFCIAKFCEPALFDYPLFREELEKEKIPHLVIEFEEKMWTFERIRNEVETFVESILFE